MKINFFKKKPKLLPWWKQGYIDFPPTDQIAILMPGGKIIRLYAQDILQIEEPAAYFNNVIMKVNI